MAKKYEKILIIGAAGGREHALGWKIAQSPRAGKLFFARGNAGTAKLGKNLDIKETDIGKLLYFSKVENIDLVLVVSDDPLATGVSDKFREAGFRTWGPTQAAAKLEWSKAFAKEFMKKNGIPTARYATFTDIQNATVYCSEQKFPLVIKFNGLALGKGVTIAKSKEEAEEALRKIYVEKVFGEKDKEVVIEEFLFGTEISIHALSDGQNYQMFPASQDHKRIFDDNKGPNTGGMGSIAPLQSVQHRMLHRIKKEILEPVIRGMSEEGTPFVGLLYPGIMLTKDGPKVFEFNTRFGDPETQSYMRILETDFLDLVNASIDGTLDKLEIKWKPGFACNIALASAGYPGNYEKGKEITMSKVPFDKEIVIFHAGTQEKDDKLVTNGGRVLGVSAVGKTLDEALAKAYNAIKKIYFEGMQYRKDIGKYAK